MTTDIWLDLFTTPDFQWGENVAQDAAQKQFGLKVHSTHKEIHLGSNPPKTIAIQYDATTGFRLEEQPSTSDDAIVVGCWVQIHEPRRQIVTVRTPASAFTSKELQSHQQGKRGCANDLTAPAILRGYKCAENHCWHP